MRAIIRGLRYDTAKSTLIGEAQGGGYNMSDWHYWCEALYRTPRSGRYFLHGMGGALSRWGESLGRNERCGGEKIQPLDDADALAWAEQHLKADEIEAAFGDNVEDA